MLDKIVMHIPVDASLVDIREDGKYCIFGFDLLDLGLTVGSRAVYKDDEGEIKHRVLTHAYSKVPTSFTQMAFKFHHEGRDFPFVELKASPAKIMQGHNVYGTDWIEQGALERYVPVVNRSFSIDLSKLCEVLAIIGILISIAAMIHGIAIIVENS
ncbi:phage/plasmid replication protein, II/X family [Acinetobacter gyllenbergii]|uniref:phage/plasmid replication protein, II/X family n=1 Tax=Acinetobacter gyllenbergii TaxID=134534 RepID=UPI003AF76523